jgi:hypothetical protein
MNARVDQLLNAALFLPETERVALAVALYASVDGLIEDEVGLAATCCTNGPGSHIRNASAGLRLFLVVSASRLRC